MRIYCDKLPEQNAGRQQHEGSMLRCVARTISFGQSHSRLWLRQIVQAGTITSAGPVAPDGAVTGSDSSSPFYSISTFDCMRAGIRSAAFRALQCHSSLLPSTVMPRCHTRVLHRRSIASRAPSGDEGRTPQCSSGCSSNGHQQQGTHSSSSTHRSTAAQAAAGAANWDNSYDGQGRSTAYQEQTEQHGCGGDTSGHSHSHSKSESHSYSHNGHHHHQHNCHDHHHHYHTNAATSSNPVLSVLSETGLFSLAEHLERHTAYTITSVSCFVAALLMPYIAAQGLLQVGTAAILSKAALAVTYLLSGIPQLAETVGAAVSGKVDTHVLMSLSIVGTLYMGMAQEGALLLLLFRVSHLLEDRLTERAAGSLQRLFDSVPDAAALVEVEESGAPRVATTQQVPASSVSIGQHVLVRPGEQVPLDGVIVWGTANLSLQHITGEEQPVKLTPGQEVPAGSLSTDGLLVIRVEATAEDSTPARIARLAAEAQAQRPQLTRWLDGVGEVWSKAVIGATLATAAVLPLLGVPFLGDRGALYRAMGVLTAGSPCALALVPLAYACAIAAITARGILIKSGAALDALAGCKTIALDKTGTITTGSLNLAEGYVVNLLPDQQVGSGSGSAGPSIRGISGLLDLCRVVARGSSSGDDSAALGTTTDFERARSGFGRAGDSAEMSAFDSDDYSYTPSPVASTDAAAVAASGRNIGFDELALKCAVALSRLSNHPVSRAMVESAPRIDGDVAVLSFEQVPGAGVQGLCRVGESDPVHVRFGAADWINSYLTDSNAIAGVNNMLVQHTDRPSRATALLSISQLLPQQHQQQQQHAEELQVLHDEASSFTASEPDAALIVDDDSSSTLSSNPSNGSGSASSVSSSRPDSRLSMSRPATPSKYVGSHANVDGSVTYSFDFDEDDIDLSPAAARDGQQQQQPPFSAISSIKEPAAVNQQQQQAAAVALQEQPSSQLSPGQQEQHLQYGTPGQPSQLALLCFEDVIQSGVPAAVQQLQSGKWSKRLFGGSSRWLLGSAVATPEKDIVMLTGDNQRVAAAVAGAVGITDYKAGLKPEDKLAYVTQAAAAGKQQGGDSSGQGLLMAGDGINDAPALAAAQVGVAIASTPKDMVAAAADIIVLNGQGITNLPWLFHVADRTHTILQQNLALALASVAVATLPTVAGMFPLWLAVTLHEGSTLLVALNSLRLLLEAGGAGSSSGSGASSSSSGKKAPHGHPHHLHAH